MSEQYLSEIRIFSFNFPPKGWAACNGQLLSIAQNQALFSLLGTSYGGDGQSTFALPNLQGGVALHGGGTPSVGTLGGEASVTLNTGQIPPHTHAVSAISGAANLADPLNAIWAASDQSIYANQAGATLAPQAIGNAGGGQAHQNMSPYLVMSFCIALVGIFPPRN